MEVFAAGFGFVAAHGAAGDHDDGQGSAEMRSHEVDDLDAGALLRQAVVGNQQIWWHLGVSGPRRHGIQCVEGADGGAPAFEQDFQAFGHGRLVFDHHDVAAVEGERGACAWRRVGHRGAHGLADRQQHGEDGAMTHAGAQGQGRVHQLGQAFDDGQAQSQAFAVMGLERALALGLVELFEDALLFFGQDAKATVPDLQAQVIAPRAAADEHATVFGVADGVGDEVAQDALDHQRVGIDMVACPMKAQGQAFFEGGGLEGQAQALEQAPQWDVLGLDVDAAGVDLGDVEEFAEQAFEGIDRAVDAVNEVGHFVVLAALAQGFGKQAERVQGLAQIVAGGGEELGFGAVGEFGLVLGAFGGRHLGAQALGQLLRVQTQADHFAEHVVEGPAHGQGAQAHQ